MSDGFEIAGHIDRLRVLMADQVQQSGGWPLMFTFPEPTSDIEREALRLFIEDVRETTGAKIIFAHRGPDTPQ